MRILGILLLALAALLTLLLFCRVGVIAAYSADGLTVRARLGMVQADHRVHAQAET